MSGEGDGRDVRYGFCATAADKAAYDVCGVMRVMSRMVVSLSSRGETDRVEVTSWKGPVPAKTFKSRKA